MKIKAKITLGVGFLFLLIVLMGVVGTRYINALKADTEGILLANYNSLLYARNMLLQLEESSVSARQTFEENLQRQERNVTEIGEEEATRTVRVHFNLYRDGNDDSTQLPFIRRGIFSLMEMNMQAIQRKSELAKQTANTATLWIVITATCCFLIAFTLLINLPATIADPIRELTQSIKQIAYKNYSERVHFEGHDEFGDLARSFNTMAEKLEEYNQSNVARLMMEKKRIEALINIMHDPVLGLDEQLNVIFVNEEASKIIGISQPNLLGVNAPTLALKNDLIRLLIQDLREEGHSTSKKNPLKIVANGKEGYFEKEALHISLVPTGEKEKVLIGHVIILRNVTEYKELEFAKTNFIATVSHEFKTPISSIKMSLQLLENQRIGVLNEEQKTLLEGINDDANRLLKITGELLNITQVESGNIPMRIKATDPQAMVQDALNATKVLAEQKHVQLVTSYPKESTLIRVDSEKTTWVLTNLISNAIRYSYEHATVFVRVENHETTLTISVQDTGQGIEPQYQAKIFDRYFKVPGSPREGTGLGLAISKEFIEVQGGRITIDSDFGAGSTFTISLPKA
ncbi:ATP-binding protein [Rhabdobacter roseus]|uniref:histidine kinase n=1 Tax=Rhabdobacter roseus TaxID=1655419 RepID=A0A840TYA5_9BACT|nr:ATP-binding protein [Rhabdobacter roseus]MBB5286592.1 PAS domain S-box-containing protein [Rhabdobacter roseus]